MSTNTLARTGQNQGAVQQRKPVGTTLEQLFAERGQELAQVAAEGMSVQRLYRTMVLCVSKNPDLAKCSAESLYRCMQDAAEVGLEPGGALGLAYLIPYAGACEYQIGYRGYIELARRSGIVNHVHPVAVFEGDVFEYEMGLQPILRHKPGQGKHAADKLTYVYAIAHFGQGMPPQFDVMTRMECEAIRARSKTRPGTGPWHTDFAEMCKKTVLRRICKILPRSIAVKTGVSVAADGRVHRTEPIRMGGQDGNMLPDYQPDMTDDEFEPAATGEVPQVAPRAQTSAEKAEADRIEEERICVALATEAARIIPAVDLDLTTELLARILDRKTGELAEAWDTMGSRDFVRILCYAMHQGRIIPLTQEIPDANEILAEAQGFAVKAE
jgi:recombination protein RecT